MQATQYDDLMRYIQDMFWYAVNTDIISVFEKKNQLLSFSQNLIQQYFCYNQKKQQNYSKNERKMYGKCNFIRKKKEKEEEI